jgi:hypothetical protein
MSAFGDRFKKTAGTYKKARTAKAEKFSLPAVPDGTYIMRVTAEAGVYKKNNVPFVKFSTVIAKGEFEGKQPSKSFYLDPDSPRISTEQEFLIKDLKTLLPDMDDEIENSDPQDVEDFCATITERNPLVRGAVKNTEKNDKKYQTVYFNEVLTDEDIAESDKPKTKKKPSPAEEEAAEEEGEEEAEVEGEEEGEVSPEKGMSCLFQPKGGKEREFTILSVNNSKETVIVKDEAGKTFKDVSWDKLTLLVAEDA